MTTKYTLFLDDERFPARVSAVGDFKIARTIAEAQEIIRQHGVPDFISFDHDLGDNEPTGYDFAKWLVDQHLNGNLNISSMGFYVHSQNPVGARNINMLLAKFMDFIS